jgi:N-acetylmuramoyl-L-alanine amidase
MSSADNKGKIVIDPGHGKYGNAHTTKEGFYEGTQNYILALYLKEYLENAGFSAVLTRSDINDDPPLNERGFMAKDAILFISLHSNAPGDPKNDYEKSIYHTHMGAETYYSLSDPEKNAHLAKMLNDAVVGCMKTKDRGIKTREYPDRPGIDYYGVLRYSVEAGCNRAVIIEHGFHTNPEDSAFLQNSECLNRLAKVEAEVICKYFSENIV